MAVAALANGYRFSKNPAAAHQFLQTLANDEHHVSEIREAARQTLRLTIGPTAKD